jgi:4-aminobutyrate aminotransferase-like enzyme
MVCPPLNVTTEELDEGISILDEALSVADEFAR